MHYNCKKKPSKPQILGNREGWNNFFGIILLLKKTEFLLKQGFSDASRSQMNDSADSV